MATINFPLNSLSNIRHAYRDTFNIGGMQVELADILNQLYSQLILYVNNNTGEDTYLSNVALNGSNQLEFTLNNGNILTGPVLPDINVESAVINPATYDLTITETDGAIHTVNLQTLVQAAQTVTNITEASGVYTYTNEVGITFSWNDKPEIINLPTVDVSQNNTFQLLTNNEVWFVDYLGNVLQLSTTPERHARILYVTATGDDATAIPGDGHYPYKTIAKAVINAVDGDIIKLIGTIVEHGVQNDKELTFELSDGNWYADDVPVLLSTSKYCAIRNGKLVVQQAAKGVALLFEILELSNLQIYCPVPVAEGFAISSILHTNNIVTQTDGQIAPVVGCKVYNKGYFIANNDVYNGSPQAVVLIQALTIDPNVTVPYPTTI